MGKEPTRFQTLKAKLRKQWESLKSNFREIKLHIRWISMNCRKLIKFWRDKMNAWHGRGTVQVNILNFGCGDNRGVLYILQNCGVYNC